jgi:hypothetical protein
VREDQAPAAVASKRFQTPQRFVSGLAPELSRMFEAALIPRHVDSIAPLPIGSPFRFGRTGPARMALPDAINGFGIAGLVGFEEVFGLVPELFKTRPRRKRL